MHGKCSYPYIHTGYLYCAKHNQHARLVNAGGSEAWPPGKFWKTATLRLNLGAFQDLTIVISHFN